MSLLIIDIGNSALTYSVGSIKETNNTIPHTVAKQNSISSGPSCNTQSVNIHATMTAITWQPLQKLSTAELLAENIKRHELEVSLYYNNTVFSCIAISSVVPTLTPLIEETLKKIYPNIPVFVIHSNLALPSTIPIVQPLPKELGSDLLANAVAAHMQKKHTASIIVDFGTATSIIAVKSNGTIAGVSIASGIKSSLQSLVGNTALLYDIDLQYPSMALGKNTKTALQSGIVLGSKYLVQGLCNHIKEELAEPCTLYATGGYMHILSQLNTFFDTMDLWHTIKGIAYIALASL